MQKSYNNLTKGQRIIFFIISILLSFPIGIICYELMYQLTRSYILAQFVSLIIIITIILICIFLELGRKKQILENNKQENNQNVNIIKYAKQNNYNNNKNGNIIKKFVRGEYSLPRSFWAFGIIGYLFLNTIGFNLGIFFGNSSIFLTIIIICMFFEIIIKFFLIIGIWNAGKYYKGSFVWVILSRIIIILLFVVNIYQGIKVFPLFLK